MAGWELQIVEWLRKQVPMHRAVSLGIGDDMSVLDTDHGRLLFASDMVLDGKHFDSRTHAFDMIGRKAIACCLSDCAAMAAKPLAATISVAVPADVAKSKIEHLFQGALAIADEFDLAVAGGDTTSWDHPLAIDVAILAAPHEGIEPVTRAGARIGDGVYVTGPLGGSVLGKHLEFRPRVNEARELARHFGPRLHAMMDISDGLSIDLWRMCQASGVGGQLAAEWINRAVSDDAKRLARTDGVSALDHALSDGEDFELLLAVEGDVSASPVSLMRVGEITGDGFSFRFRDGRVELLKPKGYVH